MKKPPQNISAKKEIENEIKTKPLTKKSWKFQCQRLTTEKITLT